MNQQSFIELRKTRTAGEIVSDTFAFMRSEYAQFSPLYFKHIGFFIIGIALTTVYSLYNPESMIGNSINGLFNVVAYSVSYSFVLHYIKSYQDNQGIVNPEVFITNYKNSIANSIGLGFMIIVALVLGFILLIIPGIYMIVPLSITFSVYVFEQRKATDALNSSYHLIKGNWWNTFGSLFLIGLISMVILMAFNIPLVVYTWLQMGLFSGSVDPTETINQDPVFVLLALLKTLAQFVLTIVSIVASALIYLGLNEQKNRTGLLEKIDNIGAVTDAS